MRCSGVCACLRCQQELRISRLFLLKPGKEIICLQLYDVGASSAVALVAAYFSFQQGFCIFCFCHISGSFSFNNAVSSSSANICSRSTLSVHIFLLIHVLPDYIIYLSFIYSGQSHWDRRSLLLLLSAVPEARGHHHTSQSGSLLNMTLPEHTQYRRRTRAPRSLCQLGKSDQSLQSVQTVSPAHHRRLVCRHAQLVVK